MRSGETTAFVFAVACFLLVFPQRSYLTFRNAAEESASSFAFALPLPPPLR
jgi:hypothetical protein